ncbi:MAG: penicillin acylase family protein [Candidatus Kapabacteria bacterium]|nr:penicillin acylase family protein [Candidatus Kapabacteria bacterium]
MLKISKRSLNEDFESLNADKIFKMTSVYVNEYGIPHIIAENEDDLFFVEGFYHARDRLWQMEYSRRSAKGILSEIFGKKYLLSDKFIRALDIFNKSKDFFQKSSPKTKAILKSYCEGINYYIENNKNSLAFEFGANGFIPDPWSPEDCIAIERLYAFELSNSFIYDIALADISFHLGRPIASKLIPEYFSNGPFVLEDSVDQVSKNQKAINQKISFNNFPNIDKDFFSEIYNKLSDFRTLSGLNGTSSGSNCWVIENISSKSKSSILANDVHLPVNLPSHWYQIHLSCPEINITGLTLPGIPLALVARNDNISFGIANIMADDADFFIEQIDSSDKNYYINDGKKEKFKYVLDTIKIKGSMPEFYYKKFAKRSVVISDAHIFNNPTESLEIDQSQQKNNLLKSYCITYSWTGSYFSDEILALYKLNRSRSFDDFQKAVSHWGSPALNFSYADTKGNIGIIASGYVPDRNKTNPNLPNQGWLSEFSWHGVKNIAQNKVLNPKKGFLIAANNRLTKKIEGSIPGYWEPSSRAERINEIIRTYSQYKEYQYSFKDAEIMQMDNISTFAKNIMRICLTIISKYYKHLDVNALTAFDMLNHWDCSISKNSAEALIYTVFLKNLINETFADELGEQFLREYSYLSGMMMNKMLEMLKKDSPFFENINTGLIENREAIVLKAFQMTILDLTESGKKDIRKIKYGEYHQITLDHLMASSRLLKPSVSFGPFPINGDNTTIFLSESHIYSPKKINIYSSMRFISDMNDSLVYFIIPGGVSGDPFSVNFSDQVQLWLNGGYIGMPHGRQIGDKFNLRTIFLPKKVN